MSSTNKVWLSPFLAVCFFVVSITGLLMLFHVQAAGLHPLHQWGGVLFIFAGLTHLTLNWKIFLSYLQKGKAWLACVAAIVLLGIAVNTIPLKGHGRYQDGVRKHQYSGNSLGRQIN